MRARYAVGTPAYLIGPGTRVLILAEYGPFRWVRRDGSPTGDPSPFTVDIAELETSRDHALTERPGR